MRTYPSVCAALCATFFVSTAPQSLAAGEDALQEIVVTAQKREQNLQSVPIAITAVTSEDLEQHNVFDAQQITYLVPGMQFSLEGEDVNIFMRGNPGTGTPTASSGTVTLYTDGILRQVTSQFQAVFTDVSRVEVARGPQGTLSGRNAFAGSINVVTNPPEFGVTRFGFDANLYNYSGSREEFFFNVPLGDALAFRLSAYRERQDGVIENVQNRANSLQDRNNDYARLQMAFKPLDNLSGVVRFVYWHGGGNGSGDFGVSVRGVPINPLTGNTTAGVSSPGIIVPRLGVSCTDPSVDPNTASEIGAPGSSPPLQGGIPGAGPCNTPSDAGPYSMNRNGVHIRDITQKEVNGEFNWDLTPNLRLRALLAYVDYSEYRQADGDYGPSGGMLLSPTNPDNLNPGGPFPGLISINEDYERTRTQEVQLLSTGHSKLQWVVGGFFEQNRSWNAFDFASTNPTPGSVPIVRTPYNFNTNPQTLRCCGGPDSDFIWYFPVDTNLNSVSAYGDATFSLTDTWRIIGGARYTRDHVIGTSYFYTLDGANNPTTDDEVFGHTTWRGGLQHDLNTNSMLYLTASTGFIAGGANPGGAAPYKPQTNNSYELGSKNMFLDGTLRLNADVYYVEYHDLLVSYFNPANSLTTATNAGDSQATGLELEVQWQPTKDLHLRGVASALHSVYGNFTFGPSALVYDGEDLPAKYGPGAKGFVADGLTTRNAPKWQSNVSADYDFHLGNYGIVTPGFDLLYVTQYRTWAQPYFFAYQDAYWQGNLRANWHSSTSNWSVDLYMNNVGNKAVRVFTTLNQGGIIYDQYQDPRMYGIRFHYRM
jgi:iron complex outermembrane recepter protein